MKKTKYYILIGLILIFSAPGIVAYVLYSHPSWVGSSRTNKGTLLPNPMWLTSVPGKEKWRLIFWEPVRCDTSCLNQLDILARVRLALGRRLYQVDQIVLLGSGSPLPEGSFGKELNIRDFKTTRLSAKETQQIKIISEQPCLFIMNPDNYLVLSYAPGVNPDDVYKDLKRLLNTETN